MENILFFGSVGEADKDSVGVKSYNLAFLFKKGFKVPPGFIITKNVFDFILSKKEIKQAINELFRCKEEEIEERAYAAQKLIKTFEFPEDIADEIIESYLSLSINLEKINATSLLENEEVYVAVRSSYLHEKGPVFGLSQKTILNIKSKDRLLKAILDCYADNFNSDVIRYKKEHNLLDSSMALIVQRMIDSEKSGMAYSINPENKNEDEILINACFGLGEGIVSGKVYPDTYLVDKSSLEIKSENISDKQYAYVRDIDTDETIKQELEGKSKKQVLYDKDIIEVARILKKIVSNFGKEQKIEWAIYKESIYILQTKEIEGNLPQIEKKEKVEMEIYDNQEEKPEIIDIIEQPDIEEELIVLEEIEKYEKEEKNKEPEKPKTLSDQEDQDNSIIEIKETEEAQKTEEIVMPEEEKPQIREEDDFIFSDYNEIEQKQSEKPVSESKNEQVEKLYELVNLNAGNLLISCHIYAMEKLKQKLKKHTTEIPSEFISLITKLKQYEQVEDEEELIKLNKLKDDFIFEGKNLKPETLIKSILAINMEEKNDE